MSMPKPFFPALCAAALVAVPMETAMGWPVETPQPNQYVLPPASDEVRIEAAAAKERLKGTIVASRFIGHRGDSESAPENTVPAFKSAAEHGFNFETDLYLTKDGVVFASHDRYLRRPGSGMNTLATNAVWKGSLENASAGAWKGPEWAHVKYPTLDDILAFAADGRFIILEIKDPRKDMIMPLVKEALARHPNVNPTNVVFQGGVDWISKNLPAYRAAACGLPRRGWKISSPPRNMVKWLRGISAKTHRLISVRWDEELVTKEFVDIAHSRGLKVVVWTVNDVDSAWAAFGRGVDYVCTDRPLSLWKEMR